MTEWRQDIVAARADMKPEEVAKQYADFDLIARVLPRLDDPKLDKNDREAFMAAFKDDRNKCSNCHKLGVPGQSSGPNLTGYGSAEWLRHMIMAPGSQVRFGKKNAMPAFRDFNSVSIDVQKSEVNLYADLIKAENPTTINELSEVDREVLIRWLTNDHWAVFGGTPISGPAVTPIRRGEEMGNAVADSRGTAFPRLVLVRRGRRIAAGRPGRAAQDREAARHDKNEEA